MSRFRPSMAWNQSFHPHGDGPQENDPSGGDGEPPPEAHSENWAGVAGGAPGAGGASGTAAFGTSPDAGAVLPAGTRAYLLPLHYESHYQYPLIVWLHSDGFNETQVQHVMPHISLRNYVAAGVRGVRAADSLGHRFDWSGSGAAVAAAHEAVAQTVEEASERFSIDRSRVILAGYHSGGSMALRVALREPQRFAGVVSLGGSLPAAGGLLGEFSAVRRRRLPMLWQWATASGGYDPERLKDDIRWAMLMQAKVEIRQYEDDDEMNTVTLGDIDRWIMQCVVGGRQWADTSAHPSAPTRFSSN